jgi:HSP20 family protein
MLMRFDPWREIDQIADHLLGRSGRLGTIAPIDAYRHGDALVVQVDVPGVDPSTLDVQVERDVLTITGRRTFEPEEGSEVLVAERPHGTFRRQLFLGEGLDLERVEARCVDGVLTLTVPVAAEVRPRHIEVHGRPAAEVASGQAA